MNDEYVFSEYEWWMWMFFVISKDSLLTSDINLCLFMCERVRGVRRAFHPLFLCKSVPQCISTSMCIYLRVSVLVFVYLSFSLSTSILVLLNKLLVYSCQIIRDLLQKLVFHSFPQSWCKLPLQGNQSKLFVKKNQSKLSFLQNLCFWQTFHLPFNLSPS